MKIWMAASSITALGLCSSCAKPPEYISPSYVSPLNYSSFSCDQIAAEEVRVNMALGKAAAEQKSAANKDAAGVFLIGLPVGSMAGHDIGEEVASLKGQKLTLDRQAQANGCPNVIVPPAVPLTAAPSAARPAKG